MEFEREVGPVGRGIISAISIGGLIIAAGVAAVYPTWQQQQDFKRGLAAIGSGDCTAAMPSFQAVVDRNSPIDLQGTAASSRTYLAVCNTLVKARSYAATGQWNWALGEYLRLDNAIEQAGIDLTVFKKEITAAAQGAFRNATPGSLVNTVSCLQIDRAITKNIVRAAEPDVPPLLLTCGRMYANRGDFDKAIAAFTDLVVRYPNHPLARQGRLGLKYSRGRLAASEQAQVNASRPPGAIALASRRTPFDPMRWVRILAISVGILATAALLIIGWQLLRATFGRRNEVPSDPFVPMPASVTSLSHVAQETPSDRD